MAPSNIAHLEDWTATDPLVADNRHLRMQNRTLQADIRAMAREIARLRRIERLAAQVIDLNARGDFSPRAPLACYTVVELEQALRATADWSGA